MPAIAQPSSSGGAARIGAGPAAAAPATGGQFTAESRPARFESILFIGRQRAPDATPESSIFSDLNLDQVIAAVTAGFEQYRLEQFFYTLPADPITIRYRQEVFADLERTEIAGPVRVFADRMRHMRDTLEQAGKRSYQRQRQWGLLDAVDRYCSAVIDLTRDLTRAAVRSEGFSGLVKYLLAYAESVPFQSLMHETRDLKADLAHVHYRLYLHDGRIEVSRDKPEPDYSQAVERTFAKFRQREVDEVEFELPESSEMNHVEAAILDLVVRLHPGVFQSLDRYCERHGNFLDTAVADFDREVQFYLAYLAYVQHLQGVGLGFCYPQIAPQNRSVECRDAFDPALAQRLAADRKSVVVNDLLLEGEERVIVVSGANQGGKTTFARQCGQLHYLGRLGCPVPGRLAKLCYFDQLFTHFEREEDLRTLKSKLEDDLARIHTILERATSESLVIMNESFSSATFHDALLLSREIMRRIVSKGLTCVFVTFLDELASFGPTVVSMTSMVDPHDLSRRTFKIMRRPADGLAYAMALADRYGLTYENIRRSVQS